MKKLFKGFKNLITSLIGIVVVLLSSICGSATFALAEESELMEELATLTVDGVAFNEADYPADKEGMVGLLSLYEYGFGGDTYALWLYVYTPKQTASDDVRNAVQMFTGTGKGYDGDGHYAKFNLKLVSTTSDKRFAKFSVVFDEETMLNCLDATERKYDVSSIELYESGTNATSYAVGRAYTYTGVNDELTCDMEYATQEHEGIRLTVNHTHWRPKGTNGKDYTYDTVHSVYFAVPKKYAEEYDYLDSIKCQWLEAKTAPIFVCGDSEIYEAFNELIESQPYGISGYGGGGGNGHGGGGGSGRSSESQKNAPDEFNFTGFNYAIAAGYKARKPSGLFNVGYPTIQAEYFFNCNAICSGLLDTYMPIVSDSTKHLSTLYWNVFAGTVDDDGNYTNGDALTYSMSSDEVKSFVENYHLFYNGKQVAGKYPSYLFDEWADEMHKEVIPAGKAYPLKSQRFEQNLWEKIFGGSHLIEDKNFNIKALEELTAANLYGGSKDEICNSLYIDKNDYEKISAFYEENKDDATVYLFRFATSEYTVMPACVTGETTNWLGITYRDIISKNAYLAQTTAFLDFDIIDFEYVKEGEHYIVPVEMSPIDIFAPVTPPPVWYDFWKYGLAIIAGLTAVGVVYGIVKKEKGE